MGPRQVLGEVQPQAPKPDLPGKDQDLAQLSHSLLCRPGAQFPHQ